MKFIALVTGCLTLGFSGTAIASNSAITLPIRFLGTFPIVMAEIEGEDVPLTFDLGDSSALVLQQQVIDRVKTIPSDKAHRGTDVKGNVIESESFILPRLNLGGAVFNDVLGRPDKHDPTYRADDLGQQGYLGTSLLKSYLVILDYPHRKMTLIPAGDDQAAKCTGTVVPFLPEWNGEAVTKARTDYGERTAVWDTGAPISLLRQPQAQDIGASELTQHSTTKHLVLGGTDFGHLKLYLANYAEPAGTDMFIGYNFFATHIVCVDFPGGRLLIQR